MLKVYNNHHLIEELVRKNIKQTALKMDSESSTHLSLNPNTGEMYISPDIAVIFDFVMGIQTEVESMLSRDEKLIQIQKQYIESWKFIEVLVKTIKDGGLDFKFEFQENPTTFLEKIQQPPTIRSEAIVIFSNLETIFALYTAYLYSTDKEGEIISKMTNTDYVLDFLKTFLLNIKNEYYRENEERLKKIKPSQLRKLRNKLTHFFAVNEISLFHNYMAEEARKIELESKMAFISTQELYSLVRGGARLLLQKWSDDYRDDPDDFKRRMKYVINIVERQAPHVLNFRKDSNLKGNKDPSQSSS